jgi:tRNA (guanine-N7-)-methyltransferase
MQSSKDLIVEPVGVEVETLARPIVWREMFGNDHPVELEIGMGKGTFLTDTAKARPGTNFFGLEYARWFWRYASDRLRRNGCTNVRTARAEAGYFIREFVGDSSLSVVHIYFPDPWPKKRHQKRRLIQAGFLEQVERILVPGGRLKLVTDHEDYFRQMEEVVGASRLKKVEYVAGEVGTNFERKYIKEGRKFFGIAAERC